MVKPIGRWAIAVVVAGALATSGVTVYNLYALREAAQPDNAKKEFERYEQLYQQGAVGASLFDTKRLEVETALRQLNETQATANQKVATLEQQINLRGRRK